MEKAPTCESMHDINDCPSCSVTQNKEWMSEDHYGQVQVGTAVPYDLTLLGTVFMCRAGLSQNVLPFTILIGIYGITC